MKYLVTASNKEIVPVIKFNEINISSGKPGEKTREIMKLFREYTDSFGRKTNEN